MPACWGKSDAPKAASITARRAEDSDLGGLLPPQLGFSIVPPSQSSCIVGLRGWVLWPPAHRIVRGPQLVSSPGKETNHATDHRNSAFLWDAHRGCPSGRSRRSDTQEGHHELRDALHVSPFVEHRCPRCR